MRSTCFCLLSGLQAYATSARPMVLLNTGICTTQHERQVSPNTADNTSPRIKLWVNVVLRAQELNENVSFRFFPCLSKLSVSLYTSQHSLNPLKRMIAMTKHQYRSIIKSPCQSTPVTSTCHLLCYVHFYMQQAFLYSPLAVFYVVYFSMVYLNNSLELMEY